MSDERDALTQELDALAVALAECLSRIQVLVDEVNANEYFDVGDFDFDELEAILAQPAPERGRAILAAAEAVVGAFTRHRTATHEIDTKACRTCQESDAAIAAYRELVGRGA